MYILDPARHPLPEDDRRVAVRVAQRDGAHASFPHHPTAEVHTTKPYKILDQKNRSTPPPLSLPFQDFDGFLGNKIPKNFLAVKPLRGGGG